MAPLFSPCCHRPSTNKTYKVTREGRGIMYKLESDGRFKELYRTDGWYTYEAYPSSDGRYLVRMGPWNRGQNVSTKDLAVAFYRDGKLLKQYSTAALVKDHAQSSMPSVSHYRWRMAEDEEPGDFARRLSESRSYLHAAHRRRCGIRVRHRKRGDQIGKRENRWQVRMTASRFRLALLHTKMGYPRTGTGPAISSFCFTTMSFAYRQAIHHA